MALDDISKSAVAPECLATDGPNFDFREGTAQFVGHIRAIGENMAQRRFLQPIGSSHFGVENDRAGYSVSARHPRRRRRCGKYDSGVGWHSIAAGKPTQNASMKAFCST